MNRRGFISSVVGLMAWVKGASAKSLSPAASAIQPTCEPNSTLKYFGMVISASNRCPRNTVEFINVGDWPKMPADAKMPDVYGDFGSSVTGRTVVDTTP